MRLSTDRQVYPPGSTFQFDTVRTNATLLPRNCRTLVYAQFAGQTTALTLDAGGANLPLRWSDVKAVGGQVTLSWPSVAGRSYTVLFTPDLQAPFAPLVTNIPAALRSTS